MYLAISPDRVELRRPEATNDLYASYYERLSPGALSTALAEHASGELLEDGVHVRIPVATLRRLAAGRVPEGWDADFDALLARAREQGRLDEDGGDGGAVRMLLERER